MHICFKDLCRNGGGIFCLPWFFSAESVFAVLKRKIAASRQFTLWCVQMSVVYLVYTGNFQFGNPFPFFLGTSSTWLSYLKRIVWMKKNHYQIADDVVFPLRQHQMKNPSLCIPKYVSQISFYCYSSFFPYGLSCHQVSKTIPHFTTSSTMLTSVFRFCQAFWVNICENAEILWNSGIAHNS